MATTWPAVALAAALMTAGCADAECDSGVVGLELVDRTFTAEVYSRGDLYVWPLGLAFDAGGALTVSNALGPTVVRRPTNLLRVDAGGTPSPLVEGLVGPSFLRWAPPGAFGGDLYVSILNSPDSHILRVAADGSAVVEFAPLDFPGRIAFGQGGAFGDLLYTTNFSAAVSANVLVRIDDLGTVGPFPVEEEGLARDGFGALVFGRGGSLGNDLWIATSLPPSTVYRVDAEGNATGFETGLEVRALAAPGPDSPFADFLYILTKRGGDTTIDRMAADGTITSFATGLGTAEDLIFGPDERLYVSNPMPEPRILRIRPCE